MAWRAPASVTQGGIGWTEFQIGSSIFRRQRVHNTLHARQHHHCIQNGRDDRQMSVDD